MTSSGQAAEFWGSVTDILQERIPSADFYSWFALAEPVSLNSDQLVVSFANGFAVKWVRDRFLGVLAGCVCDVAGRELEITLISRETTRDGQVPPTPVPPIAQAAQAAAAQQGHQMGSHPYAQVPDATEPTLVPRTHEPLRSDSMTEEELRAEVGAGQPEAPRIIEPELTTIDGMRLGTQPLIPRYRFDSFVIGEANQLAHAAALSVAEAHGQSYNPLYIYGGSGLGKTHLLHAIGHYAQETRPGINVAYVTAEHFVNCFMRAIQDRRDRNRFKDYFRGVDLLLVDDVQFLGGKGAFAQEELFYTFNELHSAGRQVVLTSDCEPSQIPKLEERLRNRFAWGLITDISVPDDATRVAILRLRAHHDGVAVESAVLEEIAARITTNIRELEGALTRVIGRASLTGRPITLDLARTVLESYVTAQEAGPITIDRIQDIVCQHFRVSREDMLSSRKSNDIAMPRQIAMYLSRVLLGAPLTQVGKRFERDHTTVRHAERKIDRLIRSDREVHDLIEQLTTTVRSGDDGVQPTR